MRTLRPTSQFPRWSPGPGAAVVGMGWVPHSDLIAVGGNDGFLALVDPLRGRVVRRLYGHAAHAAHREPDGVFTPGFSADGRLMVTGADDGTRPRMGAAIGPGGRRATEVRRRFGGADVGDVSMSPDGQKIAVARPEGTDNPGVQIFDVATHRRVAALSDDEDVWDLARFTPDGRYIVGGSWKGWVRLWSTKTWKPATRVMGGHAGEVALGVAEPRRPHARDRGGSDGDGAPVGPADAAPGRRAAAGPAGPHAPSRSSRPTAGRCWRSPTPGAPTSGTCARPRGCATRARRRPHADARRVAGRPARARLRAGLPRG